jgi:hypothetical protein
MAPWIFGHGKRLKTVETDIGQMKSTLCTVDGKMDRVLDELTAESEGSDEISAEINNGHETPSTISSYHAKLNAIEQEIVTCTEPIRLQELMMMEKEVRKWNSGRMKSRLQAMHGPRNPYGRKGAPPPREEDYEPTDAVINDVETELGQTAGKQFDPGAMFGKLQNLIQKHPTWASWVAGQMGIKDLDGAMKMFGAVVSDPAKKAELANVVGGGITNVIKGAVAKFAPVLQAPPGRAPEQGAPPGQLLINVGGQMVDPTKPYRVA